MKYLLAILTPIFYSCSHHPIQTDSHINKSTLFVGDAFIIKVSARNTSKKTIAFPTINSLGTRKGRSSNLIRFTPDIRNYSDFAISRDSVDENYIPSSQSLKPNEIKSYTFYWYGAKTERGSGLLSISLPVDFEPVESFPININ